ncbi:efflux transporter outer membrane subunit [Acidipila sp. EB88]|nr:efflux transporter outer membrane subunit [Acidipila sp. EB88]
MVGPNYKTPGTPIAPAFKEQPHAEPVPGDGWTTGQPQDAALKGNWWTLYRDPQLDALEVQIDTANQTLKASEANFRAARFQVAYNRANYAPTIGVAPAAGAVRDSANQPYFNNTLANNGEGSFQLPFDLSYEVDLWGRIRRGVASAREQGQAAAADLENARLSLHAELAIDYFDLRSTDAQLKLVRDTISAYQQAYDLTKERFDGGAAPMSDVTQARTQLDSARVLSTDLGVERTADEHAIAVLTGQPPAALTIPPLPINLQPPTMPAIPGLLPAQLLQRRPDIAASERRMASANEQIGIAQAAFYPTLSISAQGGFLGNSIVNWFTWPSRFFAVGSTLSETLYDAGRRRATINTASADYDVQVANYRQTTLSAFQQVEDNLAALRILEVEAKQQHETTASAEQSLDLFNIRYEGGVDTFLQVVTSQTAALNNERNDIDIMRRRLEASVLLVKAVGGGWDTTQLPKL